MDESDEQLKIARRRKIESLLYYRKRGRINTEKIIKFLSENKMVSRLYTLAGIKLWLLDDIKGVRIPVENINSLLKEEEKIRTLNEGQCALIGQRVIEDGYAAGMLYTDINDKVNITGSSPHYLNYSVLEINGLHRFMAFDYTAGYYIDRERGNFDVLALTAKDMDQLKDRLAKLYHVNKWSEVSSFSNLKE